MIRLGVVERPGLGDLGRDVPVAGAGELALERRPRRLGCGALRVVSRTSVMRYKRTQKSLPEIARELDVDAIVEGAINRVGDRVRITAQLVRASNDRHLWAETYERDMQDVLLLQDEVARSIAEQIQVKVTPAEHERLTHARKIDPEVYELYLKGRYFWGMRTEASIQKAIDIFQQAIAKDPMYGAAYSGLADCYSSLGFSFDVGSISPREIQPKALAAARKAAELDDSSAEAHASTGLLDLLEVRLGPAIIELERAVQLKPNYATAHHWLMFGRLSLGHLDQAVEEGKRALKLDPLSPIINADFAWTYFCARRFDKAERQARKTLEIDPQFFLAHYYLGQVLQFKGHLGEAIAEFQKAVDLNGDPDSLGMLGQAYARNGQKDEAQKVLLQLNEEAKSRYVTPYATALVYLGLGEKERALDELERAYQRGDTNYLYVIRIDPMLDDLRGHPRFDALVQKIVGGK